MPLLRKWITTNSLITEVKELGQGYYIDNYTFNYDKYVPYFEKLCTTCLSIQAPCEKESFSYLGIEKNWAVVLQDKLEDKIEWTTFGRRGVMMNVFLYTILEAKESAEYEFLVSVKGSAAIAVNGNLYKTELKFGSNEQKLTIKTKLQKGKNNVVVGLMNMHVHAECGFSMVANSEDVSVSEELTVMKDAEIEQIREELSRFYMSKSIFVDDEKLSLCYEDNDFIGSKYKFLIYSYDGFDETMLTYKSEKSYTGAYLNENKGRLEILNTTELENGRYIIITQADGIEGARLTFAKRKIIELPVNADFFARREFILNMYADMGIAAAMLEKGNAEIDTTEIRNSIRTVNNRYDCADFALHDILRLYSKYHDMLDDDLRQEIKQAILDFKYDISERGETMMFTRSENHQFSFFTAEFIAGTLFPDEIFTSSGQNGVFHIFRGRYNCEKWIKEKGSYGFQEWYSNEYLPVDVGLLLDLYDFAGYDIQMKQMAKNLLDFLMIIIASHSSKGIMGCVHARCYEYKLLNPEDEGIGHLMWLLFGANEMLYDTTHRAAVSLITSSYVPDGICEKIAREDMPVESLSRMGLYRYDNRRGVNIYCYRTKEYILSGLMQSRAGEKGAQVQAGQILLGGKAPVYVTCFDGIKKNTRPSYWSGQYKIPKTVANKNLLAHIYNLDDNRGNTHCYFPSDKFDCIKRSDRWTIGKVKDAYVAVFCNAGYTNTDRREYKNKELLSTARKPIWLLVAGSKEEYGSFERFAKMIEDTTISNLEGDIIAESEIFGEVYLSWSNECKINGKAFIEKDFPLFSNNYAYSEYGSGYVRIKQKEDKNFIIFD